MEISIFGETTQIDQLSYEKLIERIIVEHFALSTPIIRKLDNIIIRGKPNLLTQLPFLLGRITRKYSKIICIYIFIDADGDYPTVTNSEKKRVKNKIKKFVETYAGGTIIGVPTRNMEAWLLGDIGNINNISGLNLSLDFTKVEEIKNPKDEFKKIYSEYKKKNGRRALSYPDFVTTLFSSLNFRILKSHSKTFSALLKDIKSYLKLSKQI